MHQRCAAVAAFVFAGMAFAGGDFNPPTWRGKPYSTTQGWSFVIGAAIPGATPDNDLVPKRNPNELPENQFIFPGPVFGPQIMSATRQQVNFTSPYMSLLPNPFGEQPASVTFAIPNYSFADTSMLMRIQVVYRGAQPILNCRAFNNFEEQNFPIQLLNNPIDVVDPDRPDWRRLWVDVEFRESTQWQAVSLLNDSIFLTDIDTVVIDTIVPAPGGAAFIGLGLVVAGRRRR